MRYIEKPVDDENMSVGLSYIIKYIKQRIRADKNFMATVIGQTGSGKSFAVLGLMELIYPDKSKEEIINYVHFEPKPFLNHITDEKTKSGEMFSFDESGVGQNSKNWQSLINRMINYILQTFRYKNLVVFFCLPHFTFLDADTRKLVHAVFETKKVDRIKKVVLIKPLFIQTNNRTGQMYFKYLRVKHKGKLTPIKVIEIPKPSDELITLYKQKKENYTTNLYEEIITKIESKETKQKLGNGYERLLTPIQRQHLNKYAELQDCSKVGEFFNKSTSTVYTSLRSIMFKLNANSFEELVNLVKNTKEIEVSAL